MPKGVSEPVAAFMRALDERGRLELRVPREKLSVIRSRVRNAADRMGFDLRTRYHDDWLTAEVIGWESWKPWRAT